jgi:hypothetical protein
MKKAQLEGEIKSGSIYPRLASRDELRDQVPFFNSRMCSAIVEGAIGSKPFPSSS